MKIPAIVEHSFQYQVKIPVNLDAMSPASPGNFDLLIRR